MDGWQKCMTGDYVRGRWRIFRPDNWAGAGSWFLAFTMHDGIECLMSSGCDTPERAADVAYEHEAVTVVDNIAEPVQ